MKLLILEVILKEGVISPEQLPQLAKRVIEVAREVEETTPDIDGVVLSGRLPVWAFAALAGSLMRGGYSVVATYDPRLQSGVTVYPQNRLGELLPLDGAEKVVVEF